MDPLESSASMTEAALPSSPSIKVVDAPSNDASSAEETRVAVEPTMPLLPPPHPQAPAEVKENRWKLAFRQLMFMKGMNMQVNTRNKNEIELRQHNITPLSLMCSVPFFNTFSASQIQALVDASQRVQLRPGDTIPLLPVETLGDQKFFIVSSGNLAIASTDVENARAVQQANLSPQFKLGIGDYFAIHRLSNWKVIAMEPVEYLVVPMEVIHSISATATTQIEQDKCAVAHEIAETESFKQWALQFTLANTHRPIAMAMASDTTTTTAPAVTSSPSGVAKSTVKQFSRDILLHLSPENELDHTLEHMKNTLLTTFGGKCMRMFLVNHEAKKLVVKFADEPLSRGIYDLDSSTVAQEVIDKRAAVFVASMASHCDTSTSDLYRSSDRVLAAPFFEFDPMGATTHSSDAAKIVGILEIVLGPISSSPSMSEPAAASDNDRQILEVATQELGRYLYFHYQDFFTITDHSDDNSAAAVTATEVFPAPISALDVAVRPLTLSLDALTLEGSSVDAPVTHAVVSVRHGKFALSTKKIPTRPSPPSKDKSCAVPRSFTFDGQVDMDVSLGDIPHGSHLLIHFFTTKNTLVAWTGLHLFGFGHDLRTGKLDLDVSISSLTMQTALEIENCLKRDRTGKKQIAGVLQLTVDGRQSQNGSSSPLQQGFSFSSIVKKKKNIAFRASIFADKITTTKTLIHQQSSAWKTFPQDKQKFLTLLRGDPLVELSSEDKTFVWGFRYTLSEDSALLPAFLQSVNWAKRDQVMEAYRLLIQWRQPTYLQALQLLSPLYPDPKVRAYAVRCMHSLPDHRLRLYLLQLVQALKNERYHDSALARFLLMRALQNPAEIGYSLYWFLKAEAHVDTTSERFALLMDEYLQLCGSYKLEIRQSVFVMKKLDEIATLVKQETTNPARKAKLHEALRATVLPETFQLPLQPRTYCTGIIVEPCRVMESKKRPLLLQLESSKAAHGNPFVIFKSGDDLRQDQLVLQILRVMDDLWREAELDLCLSPYACISTGDELGLIEVVGNSSTLASIIYDRHENSTTKLGRKIKSAKDALMGSHVISEWLFQAEPDTTTTTIDETNARGRASSGDLAGAAAEAVPIAVEDIDMTTTSPAESAMPASPVSPQSASPDGAPVMEVTSCLPSLSPSRRPKKAPLFRDVESTQTFLRSCAGYCVATYVLGIGDRHNDNIMLQRTGKFFHIDFGHFLGNFKSKFGIKREKAPFVFTPAMLHVIGGKGSDQYTQFQQIAREAFQLLRTHSNLLITLLVLALTCGTPELSSEEDIKWVHRALMLELSDAEAGDKFLKLIDVALNTKTTLVNDAVHLMAH